MTKHSACTARSGLQAQPTQGVHSILNSIVSNNVSTDGNGVPARTGSTRSSMNLSTLGGRRSISPASSRASSPVPRIARRTAEDGSVKNDKYLRRYAAIIERALASWEASPEEWADYIAFLSRLLKAIQSHGQDTSTLPHNAAVASRLAQCLNAALPSGVHQKTLELYAYIFSTFGQGHVSTHLPEYLPGLATVLSFASLSVRPALYDILEKHIICLPTSTLRPVLKSLILSLLPALEDETSEDFERALSILARIQHSFTSGSGYSHGTGSDGGYFWQCVFLSIITSPLRRLGGFNFLARCLPRFQDVVGKDEGRDENGGVEALPAEVALEPEPGLLIRAFECGLCDPQALIQRGFLDLLVDNLPLGSFVLQHRVRQEEIQRLTRAVVTVLLKKDQNLNRRVFAWFLGPTPNEDGSNSPNAERRNSVSPSESQQLRYFTRYGQQPLTRCLLVMLSHDENRPAGKARAYRICLSLMDRWEIGGALVPHFFLPAVRSVFIYSQSHSREETTEVLRSASLFFDGVESHLIWTELFRLLRTALSGSEFHEDEAQFFLWILQHFSMKEEEMLTLHVPLAMVYLLDTLVQEKGSWERSQTVLDIAITLLDLLPPRVLSISVSKHAQAAAQDGQQPNIRRDIEAFYRGKTTSDEAHLNDLLPHSLPHILADQIATVLLHCIEHTDDGLSKKVQLLLSLLPKLPENTTVPWPSLLRSLSERLNRKSDQWLSLGDLTMVVWLLSALSSSLGDTAAGFLDAVRDLNPHLIRRVWSALSPFQHRNHIEAVRLIWQLDEVSQSEATTKGVLNELVRYPSADKQTAAHEHVESIRRFATLWTHSLPAQPLASKADVRTIPRRGSSMPVALNPMAWDRRQDILTGPLFLALDILAHMSDAARDVVCSLVSSITSATLILRLLLDRMLDMIDGVRGVSQAHRESELRSNQQQDLNLIYVMRHLEGLLGVADATIWQALNETNVVPQSTARPMNGAAWVALRCVGMLGERGTSSALSQRASSVLGQLFLAPRFIKLTMQGLNLEEMLMSKIIVSLEWQDTVVQNSLLKLAVLAMGVRNPQQSQTATSSSRRSSSFNPRRRSSMMSADEVTTPTGPILPGVPPKLVETLRAGFASSMYPLQTDIWLDFLTSSLPFLGNALLASLLPLVDTLCKQINATLDKIRTSPTGLSDGLAFAPDHALLSLLDSLNLLLAEAHDQGAGEEETEVQRNTPESSQSVLGTMASGLLKTQVHQSRTSKANSRLTVIIASKEAVRACVKVWIWATHNTGGVTNERYGTATLTYNATRIRNRTRQMLEQIFNVELLESLEVIMSLWCQTPNVDEGREVLSLLHAMSVSRPQSVVPAILDALCSRTNANSLSPTRQSSLTSDLTAPDVVAYLTAYLESVDDDAMDEVWPDCTAFIRDVLANPLPFRHVLPALLWVTLVLAEKLNNTNFGDHKKMRRGLGDNFQKLLAASFATSSHGSLTDTSDRGRALTLETSLVAGRRALNLVVILKHISASIENLLESSDRITTTVNAISSSVIAPALHAKTFPAAVNADLLALFAQIARKAPAAKSWRRELSDAFNRPQFLNSSADMMEQFWFPVLQQWLSSDRDRIPDILSKLTPPSSAGIMFGVGASAARTKADGETQFILRRLCLLMLASTTDSSVVQLQAIEAKVAELFDSTPSSSPSFAVKAELFMLLRAIILTIGPTHLSSMWPLINDQLQAALTSLTPQGASVDGFTNFALLQAVKLLDLLIATAPDDFQLHEWLYITDTTDAVYHPPEWEPAALSDQLAEYLGSDSAEDGMLSGPTPMPADAPATDTPSQHQRQSFGTNLGYDMEDVKAMSREDFAKAIVRPFLSQLSINAYETVYAMEPPALPMLRRSLLEDLLDVGTLVEHER